MFGKSVVEPIAVAGVTNSASLAIYAVDEDYVEAGIVTDTKRDKPRTYKLYRNGNGDAYFNFGRVRWYLSEFMRLSK